MEIIENNVLKKVRITYPRKTIEDYQKLERKFFTWSDLSIVFEEMSKSSNPQTQRIKLILEFLFLTGLRYCELAALKVENYDTDNKVISIESDIDYSEGISKKRHVTTKTLSSYRRVPLTGRAIDIIEQIISENQRNISYGYSDYGYIFTSRTGNPWSISGINRSFRNFGKRTGLDKQFSCHCMRHSHISLLAELEVSQKAVMQRVGHSSSRITNEIYTHVTPKMNQKLLEKLNSFSGQKVGKTE
ncbi:site-specific integrase, partial [Lactococcus lactis subsp. lactis]